MKVKFDENSVRVDLKDNKVIDVEEVNSKKKEGFRIESLPL